MSDEVTVPSSIFAELMAESDRSSFIIVPFFISALIIVSFAMSALVTSPFLMCLVNTELSAKSIA